MKRLPIGVVLFFFALGGLFGCGEKIEPGTTIHARSHGESGCCRSPYFATTADL